MRCFQICPCPWPIQTFVCERIGLLSIFGGNCWSSSSASIGAGLLRPVVLVLVLARGRFYIFRGGPKREKGERNDSLNFFLFRDLNPYNKILRTPQCTCHLDCGRNPHSSLGRCPERLALISGGIRALAFLITDIKIRQARIFAL